jgi:hypothetical protein
MPNDDWRVGHRGRDSMYYEELVDGEWRRLDLAGEMSTARAHHVIYFGSKAEWQERPEWARSRRSELLARIKSAFPIPEYEYEGEAVLDDGDRQCLIAAAGGLSRDRCCWAGCGENALAEKLVCVYHAYSGQHDGNPATE